MNMCYMGKSTIRTYAIWENQQYKTYATWESQQYEYML